jgi:hypothetical protein
VIINNINFVTVPVFCCNSVKSLKLFFFRLEEIIGPPLWSSGQCSWLQIQTSRVRFPALPDFVRSGGSGSGSTQPREDNCGAT